MRREQRGARLLPAAADERYTAAIMFTGLVQQVARVLNVEERSVGLRLRFSQNWGALDLGESIAVSGACLTVVESTANSFAADLSPETLDKTILGRLRVGSFVNLERALKVGDRLGGHLVSGHVDGVGEVTAVTPEADMTALTIKVGRELGRYAAQKGSITIDGVSLTVNRVTKKSVALLLIPHTLEVTTLGALQVGHHVNVEVDLIARYVERLRATPL